MFVTMFVFVNTPPFINMPWLMNVFFLNAGSVSQLFYGIWRYDEMLEVLMEGVWWSGVDGRGGGRRRGSCWEELPRATVFASSRTSTLNVRMEAYVSVSAARAIDCSHRSGVL